MARPYAMTWFARKTWTVPTPKDVRASAVLSAQKNLVRSGRRLRGGQRPIFACALKASNTSDILVNLLLTAHFCPHRITKPRTHRSPGNTLLPASAQLTRVTPTVLLWAATSLVSLICLLFLHPQTHRDPRETAALKAQG